MEDEGKGMKKMGKEYKEKRKKRMRRIKKENKRDGMREIMKKGEVKVQQKREKRR